MTENIFIIFFILHIQLIKVNSNVKRKDQQKFQRSRKQERVFSVTNKIEHNLTKFKSSKQFFNNIYVKTWVRKENKITSLY